jgi:hypothetical protein
LVRRAYGGLDLSCARVLEKHLSNREQIGKPQMKKNDHQTPVESEETMNTNFRAQLGVLEESAILKGTHYAALAALTLSLSIAAVAQDRATGGDVVHAVGGVVTKVDSVAKTIAVKLADGTEQVFKYSAKTTARASKDMAKGARTTSADTYMAGKEGTHVVVHYTSNGADKTAVAVDDFGKDGLKFSQGTVTHFDRAARTVTIKSEDGTEETYHVAKDATIDTEHGVVRSSELAAKNGEKVTVHYSEDAGKKLVHLFRHV